MSGEPKEPGVDRVAIAMSDDAYDLAMKHVRACVVEMAARDSSEDDPRRSAITAVQALMSVCASSFGSTLAVNGVPLDQIEGLAETIGADIATMFLGGATKPRRRESLFEDAMLAERKRRSSPAAREGNERD